MTNQETKTWRCTVCGYLHKGPTPPKECPVCGSPSSAFEPFAEQAPVAAPKPLEQDARCMICGYVAKGGIPPACPVCGAEADRFEPYLAPEAVAHEGKRRVVIVGGGIAGVSAAESVRASSASAEIVLICKEPDLPYYRLNLTRYLAGEITADALPIYPTEWYAQNGILLYLGTEVEKIDPGSKTLRLSGNHEEHYDSLILTAGAHAFMPEVEGSSLAGVFSVRSRRDVEQILGSLSSGMKCVCIGGGILGLEAAGAMARRGAQVTVLENYGWLLPRQLNQRGAGYLEAYLQSQGIAVAKEARTQSILGDERAKGVRLKDGREFQADIVIFATGIRPNSYLARQAGLTVNQGIVVDDLLRTNIDGIYAAGDAAEHRGIVYGIWPASQYMGKIAGINAAGGSAEFAGIPRSNSLKVLGIDLFSIGVVEPEDGSYIELEEASGDVYKRLLFRDNRLMGAILMGDSQLSATAKQAIESKHDLGDFLSRKAAFSDIVEYFA